jgi:hypothetical protein
LDSGGDQAVGLEAKLQPAVAESVLSLPTMDVRYPTVGSLGWSLLIRQFPGRWIDRPRRGIKIGTYFAPAD